MTLEAKFQAEEIIPDVVDEAPLSSLRVAFASQEIDLGNELTPSQVRTPPAVSWSPEPNSFYTLIFTDPDAPSRANPIRREFLHWLIGNIPGGDVGKGEVLAEYVGSAPPKGSDLHRYTFLLYKQNGRISFEDHRITAQEREPRRHFSARKFAERYGLGRPVAGNYYLAQWDESVG